MAKYMTAFFAVLILAGSSSFSFAADTYTCTLSRAYSCFPDEGCREQTIEEMELPYFARIDLKGKIINSLDKKITKQTKITAVERPEGMIVMHGAEHRGWSMVIGEESGDLSLSVAGDGEAFTVFGKCIAER